ncbi:MAG: isoprenylcysteine carboxylmethyltransferase family protein [Gemmatimonadaceae bacterium]
MSATVRSAERPSLWLVAKTALFTLVAPACVGTLVPRALARGAAGTPAADVWAVAAFVPLALGAAIYLWCAWDFMAMGRGTPAPIDAPIRLVVRGLYRYVRNPMYVGVLAMVAGWALWYRSVGIATYAAGLALLFHAFVRLYEEPALQRRFGQEYSAYCRQVHRWLPSRPMSMRV